MAKASDDVILRDRMQFTADANGDLTTLYGRIDLSAYVNPVSRAGISVKEIKFQLRNPTSTQTPNTGCFPFVAESVNLTANDIQISAMKLYATTRAYENAADVGIASPDVLCVYQRMCYTAPTNTSTSTRIGQFYSLTEDWYGPADLHPEGYTVVSDLLIGLACDDWQLVANQTVEVDVLIVAEPIKVTESRLNELLSQGLDL